jgi:hypothetical protein
MTTALTAAYLFATPSTIIPAHVFQNVFKYNDPQQGIDNSLLIGRLGRVHLSQAVAATTAAGAASCPNAAIADHPGRIVKALVTNAVAPAGTGTELMTIDIQKNGVTIFSGPGGLPTLSAAAATPAGIFDVTSLIPAAVQAAGILVGDVITMVRTYAAGGGGPAMTYTDISLDWG